MDRQDQRLIKTPTKYRELRRGRAARRLVAEFGLFLTLVLLSAVACSFNFGFSPALAETSATATRLSGSPFPLATFGPVVSMTRPPVQTEAVEPGPTADACPADATGHLAQYDVDATINMKTHAVNVKMRATYRNETDRDLKSVMFVVEPNRGKGTFALVNLAGAASTRVDKFALTGAQIEILLKEPLKVHCTAAFDFAFTLALGDMTQARRGYLAYSDRQLNLGDWLPEIAPFLDGAWVTPASWPEGEYTVAEMSDFHVVARVQDAPDKTDLIGPGQVKRIDDTTWQFDAPGLRSFTLCASASMSKLTTINDNGIEIDLYSFTSGQPAKSPHDNSPINGPQHALETARIAANIYDRTYHPLNYKRLAIVEGDFPDGMEFSGLVYVGHQWFAGYDGKDDSWLTLITAHEVSHQWWYSLVSNNQSTAPYLDETLAIYSELIFIEDQYPSLVSWWWAFRVKVYNPQGYVDSAIYDFNNTRPYINAVYLRGALMLQEIRDSIGDAAFFDWLKAYAASEADHIATPPDFWKAMQSADYAQIAPIRAKYLRVPDPLHPPTATPSGSPTPAPASLPTTVRPATASAPTGTARK